VTRVSILDAALNHAAATASRHETDQFEYEDWQAHAVDPRAERD
jgi:hypothetical protein